MNQPGRKSAWQGARIATSCGAAAQRAPRPVWGNIIVIGSGSLTVRVAALLQALDRNVTLLEIRGMTTFPLARRAQRHGVPVKRLDKKDVADYLLAESARQSRRSDAAAPLLVVSAENMYIFPARVTDHPGIVLINYHNSLLPRHRGMNAEAWAIFEGDARAGFSWHRIDSGLDTGDVLYQESFPIASDDTALSLLNTASKRAAESFRSFFAGFEDPSHMTQPTAPDAHDVPGADASYHSARDKPNDGIFDTAWSFAAASGFLRAYDYGKLALLGNPTIDIAGAHLAWERYRISAVQNERLAGSEGGGFLERDVRRDSAILRYPGAGTIVLEGLHAPQSRRAATA